MFHVIYSKWDNAFCVCAYDGGLIVSRWENREDADADCETRNRLAKKLNSMLAEPPRVTARIG